MNINPRLRYRPCLLHSTACTHVASSIHPQLRLKMATGKKNTRVPAGTRPGGRRYEHESVPAGMVASKKLCPTGKATRVRKEHARTRKPAKPALTCGATAKEVYNLIF
jgi:hypothetical protein